MEWLFQLMTYWSFAIYIRIYDDKNALYLFHFASGLECSKYSQIFNACKCDYLLILSSA